MSAVCRLLVAFSCMFAAFGSVAAEPPEYLLTIENHQFAPAELRIPAGEKVRLRIENRDPTAEEFESHDLNREKLIAGGGSATLFVGPLKAGTYRFFGEFNEATCHGRLIVE